MTTFTEQQILDMAIEIAEDHPGHNGLDIAIDEETLANMLDTDMWVEIFNEDEDSGAGLAEDVADIVRRFGKVTTKLGAEVEIDGTAYYMTWIPQNVSGAHLEHQWAIAFADEDNPPRVNEIHQENGHWQEIAQMTQVDTPEELSEGYCYLEPLEEDE